MFSKVSLPFLGFLQATGLVLYLSVLATFFTFVAPHLDESGKEFFAPITFLLMFIISAVVSATLVLGRSAIFFWEKDYKSAFTLLAYTVLSCFGYFIVSLLVLSR